MVYATRTTRPIADLLEGLPYRLIDGEVFVDETVACTIASRIGTPAARAFRRHIESRANRRRPPWAPLAVEAAAVEVAAATDRMAIVSLRVSE